jgi:hypothetical protein
MGFNRRNAGNAGMCIAAIAAVVWISHAGRPALPRAGRRHRDIKGRIKLTGPAPVNPMIRLGMDPLCSKANPGKRPNNEDRGRRHGRRPGQCLRSTGGIAAARRRRRASLSSSIRKGASYSPRVVGAQAGQTLRRHQQRHPSHTTCTSPTARSTRSTPRSPRPAWCFNYTLKKDDTMLRLGCMIHSWMTAYIGVVPHPFYAVTDNTGTFNARQGPAGQVQPSGCGTSVMGS